MSGDANKSLNERWVDAFNARDWASEAACRVGEFRRSAHVLAVLLRPAVVLGGAGGGIFTVQYSRNASTQRQDGEVPAEAPSPASGGGLGWGFCAGGGPSASAMVCSTLPSGS